MPETEIPLKISGNNRKGIKDTLILEFLKEEPGKGKGDLTSVYYYYVEKTQEGIDIYLKRPARLNKGMDFEVHAEDVVFANKGKSGRITRSSKPSHPTIYSDLIQKKQENASEYKKVEILIDKLYSCSDVADLEMSSIQFKSGYSIELILKLIKWLFIEQDVTYWNWSGRDMFYSGLKKI